MKDNTWLTDSTGKMCDNICPIIRGYLNYKDKMNIKDVCSSDFNNIIYPYRCHEPVVHCYM